MTPRCSFPITRRRTCGVELHGIYSYCPEHMRAQLANPMGELKSTQEARDMAEDYAARVAVEVEE